MISAQSPHTRVYETLSELCRHHGIYEFGITSPQAFDCASILMAFDLEGFSSYSIEKRLNPFLTMETAKSIICALFPYKEGEREIKITGDIKGAISSGDINFGADYHIYVRKILENICCQLKELFNGEYLIFCDTGPLLDKEIAVRAGVAKYGRNSLAVNSRYGTLFYIGYIITDLDFGPYCINEAPSLWEQCIDCKRCIESCPAGAIHWSKVSVCFSHKKCLSYISQKKSELTINEQIKLKDTVYGCHKCQEVCPANNFKGYTLFVDVKENLNLSNKEFKRKFGDTAACWLGRKTFTRNLINVLNNYERENI